MTTPRGTCRRDDETSNQSESRMIKLGIISKNMILYFIPSEGIVAS